LKVANWSTLHRHSGQSGELVDLAPAFRPRIALYWQHWMLEPEPAQRLTQAVIASARTALDTAALPA
jgi:hypothetical protein